MSTIELFFGENEIEEENTLEQAKIRRKLRDASNPMDLAEHMYVDKRSFLITLQKLIWLASRFIQNFRLSKEAFLNVFLDINDKLKPTKRQQSIPNILKFAAVLRFLAQGFWFCILGQPIPALRRIFN